MPLDSYLDAGMTAIEMHIDCAGPRAEDLFDIHRKIQISAPLLIWGNLSDRDFDWLITELPPEGLAIIAVVDGPEQAEEYWRRFASRYLI